MTQIEEQIEALHMTVAALLRDHCLPEWEWTHFPAGELRDKKTAAKLKQMGLRPGWPDFILLDPNDKLHLLELKRPAGKTSDCQSEFLAKRIDRGTPCAVCHTIDGVLYILEIWGCLRVTRSIEKAEALS